MGGICNIPQAQSSQGEQLKKMKGYCYKCGKDQPIRKQPLKEVSWKGRRYYCSVCREVLSVGNIPAKERKEKEGR